MNTLALRLIAKIMGWDDDEATREYGWLRHVAAPKYDGYADFRAGSRFIESLAAWLLQFDEPDREAAYSLVRERLDLSMEPCWRSPPKRRTPAIVVGRHVDYRRFSRSLGGAT